MRMYETRTLHNRYVAFDGNRRSDKSIVDSFDSFSSRERTAFKDNLNI